MILSLPSQTQERISTNQCDRLSAVLYNIDRNISQSYDTDLL